MSVFVCTDDGQLLLVDLVQRRQSVMADFTIAPQDRMTDIALTEGGRLLGSDGRLVFELNIATGKQTNLALISAADVVSVDADSSERAIIGCASGQVWRQERDASLTDIGRFANGIEAMARIGGFVFAATKSGTIEVMNLLNGHVDVLMAHGLGTVDAMSAEGRMLRLTVSPGSSTPQFFTFDPDTLALTFESGLLNFYDQITGSTSGEIATVTFTVGPGSASQTVIGTAQADVMIGHDTDTRLYGRDGNDTISAGDGSDWLGGEEGRDLISGGAGDDYLSGGIGDDTLDGGAGDDLLEGGDGSDWALFTAHPATVDLLILDPQRTGDGIDQLVGIENLRGSTGADLFQGNASANTFEGDAGNDTLIGRDGNDTLRGNAGADWLNGGNGDDFLNGGIGFDMADYSDAAAAVLVDLSLTFWQDTGGAGRDRLLAIEGVKGSDAADTLLGNDQDNSLHGQGGDDSLLGGAGADRIWGNSGNDFLHGGSGADNLNGGIGDDTLNGGLGAGIDTLTGGTGADVFVYTVVAPDGQTEDRVYISDFFYADGDRIDLVGIGPASFDRWTLSTLPDASGALIQFQNGTELVLLGTDATQIAAEWFF